MATITKQLNKDDYATFTDFLSMLEKFCQDVQIEKGMVCQKSNENSMILKSDLTKLLGNVDLSLSALWIKNKLFTPFKKQGVDVRLAIDDYTCSLYDQYSRLTIQKPINSLLTNQYKDQQFLDQALNMDLTKKVADFEFTNNIIERLTAYSDALDARKVNIKFTSNQSNSQTADKASFILNSGDKANTYKCNIFSIDEVFNCPEGVAQIDTIAFTSNSSVKIEIWRTKAVNEIVIAFKSFVDETTQQIPLTIYTKSKLLPLNSLAK